MKQRVITALVSILIFAAAMVGYYTVALNLAFSLLIAIALWELFHATGLLKHKPLYIVSTIYGVLMPFAALIPMEKWILTAGMAAYVFVILVIAMKQHQKISFAETCMTIVISNLFPLCFMCLLLTRSVEPVYGIFYLIIACFIAWGGDTFAYFSGRFFGKHKLAPVISPKKTIEGVVGGFFGSIIFALIIALGFSAVMGHIGQPVHIRYEILLPAVGVLSLVSVFGDLNCSLIKRQYGIKDYGTIFPGHGGVMDRFDSVLMVAPFIYFLMKLIPVVLPA